MGFNKFYLNKEMLEDIHSVDDLDNLYDKYTDYLFEFGRKQLTPEEFVGDLVWGACNVKHESVITLFLEQYYEAKNCMKILDEILFFTITPVSRYISSFRVGRDKYSALVDEYDFQNKSFLSRRYDLTLNYLHGKETYLYIDKQICFSQGECITSIRRHIRSSKEYVIKWFKVDE